MAKLKIPKTLGACADKLYCLREERMALKKEIDKIETNEKALKEHLIQNLSKEKAEGIKGRLAKVGITRDVVPHATDWGKFYKYLKRTGSFELMQRRFNDKAIKERWEDKKKIPGVEPFNILKVSLTKVSR